jgi:hypothetical protein
MRTRWILAAAAAIAGAAVLVVACASEDRTEPIPPDAAVAVPATDAAEDVASDVDASTCADCTYFPEVCSAGVLCQSGPFLPGAPGGSLDPRIRINVVRGRSATDVWAGGALGALAHYDGTSWKLSELGVQMSISALWLRSPGEVAIAAMRTLYTRGLPADADASAGGWSASAMPSAPGEFRGTNMTLMSTFAAPGAEWMWCATRSEDAVTEMRTSGLWRVRMAPSGGFEIGIGVAPETCRFTYPCTQMTSIHGVSPSELWAVGLSGATVRVRNADGDAPAVDPFNSQTLNALNGVWVAPNGEAWSVGAQGTIRHYHGDPLLWDIVTGVPTTVDLNAVWGTSPSDIWAVGNLGVVLHYDGAVWARVPIAGLGQRRPNLTTVWTPSQGHVWVGGQGVLLALGGNP